MTFKIPRFIKKLRRNRMAIVVSVCAAFGGFLYGYDTGTIAGILDMEYFIRTFGHRQSDGRYILAASEQSLIVSTLSAGTFIGALLGYPSSDFYGRRLGIVLACFIFSIGVLMQTVTNQLSFFAAGRFFAGLGVGIISCVVPLYQSECAPKRIRGAIVSFYGWFVTIGLLVAAIVDNATEHMLSYYSFRIPIGIQLLWAIVLLINTFFLPESPRYLVMKGQIDQAYQSQAKLNSTTVNNPQIDANIKEIIGNMQLAAKHGSNSYIDCFKMGPHKNLLRTLVGIGIQACQQLTGINFIIYYGTSFFHSSGMQNPFLISIIANIVNVVMTIPGMLIVDKFNRRKLLLIGAAGMSICEYIVAIVGTFADQSNEAAQKMIIAFICMYMAFFASIWGPIPGVVIGELYPLAIRAKCMSLSTASNWLWNFAIGYITPYLISKNSGNLDFKVFFVWGSTCAGCLIFSFFCIWETKGLSLEEVDYLIRNSSTINSAKLNKALRSGRIPNINVIDDDSVLVSPLLSSSG